MNKRQRTIHNALPIVAAAYGRKFDVKVQIGRDMAYTDGKTIVVPNIPEDYPHKDALWGYLAHEAAHVRLTDFSVQTVSDLHHAFFNIFEDARIEREMISIYPGTAHTLNEVARYMASAGHYEVPCDDWPAAKVLEAFCLYYLQCEVVGQKVIADLLARTRAVYERKFPKGVQVRLHALLRKVWKLTSSQEAADLASSVIQMLEEEAQKSRPPSAPSSNKQDQTGDSSQGSSSSQAGNNDPTQDDQQPGGSDAKQQSAGSSSSGDDGTNSNVTGSPGQSQAGADDASQNATTMPQKAGNSGGDTAQATGPKGSSTSSDPAGDAGTPMDKTSQDDTQQVLREVLSAGKGDHINDAHKSLREELMEVADEQGDASYRTVKEAARVMSTPDVGKDMQAAVRSSTSRIRTQLMGLVQASQRTAHRTARHGKRLDTARLSRLVAGDTRIFRQRAPKRWPNTAVHLLVDASSSMLDFSASGKRRNQVASEAAMAIGLALEPINGVNPAVTFFGNNDDEPVYSAVRHGESVSRNASYFGMHPTGTTPMAEAIWHAAFELVQTREERKMLIVVTDGVPDDKPATRAVIDLCENSGLDMIGIGIETRSVSHFFSHHVVIDDVDDLKHTLFQLMERSLTVTDAA